jgi:hypothetical protein
MATQKKAKKSKTRKAATRARASARIAGERPDATKRRRRPATTNEDRKGKKISALDAAAKVLEEEGRPMTCKEMIETMAAKRYWNSPGGKTPTATLYSAILRELATKKGGARFRKTERGKFALKA